MVLWYRMMGTKIGSNVSISGEIREFDLVGMQIVGEGD